MPTESITIGVLLKNLSYIGAFMVGVEWLGFNAESLVLLSILMLCDVITALFRVSRLEGARAITSSSFKKGVTAKFLLITGLFAIAIASKGIGFDMRGLAQGAVTVIMLGELYSILGNIHSARTGTPKVEFDAVAFLLAKVKTLLDKLVS